MKIPLIRSDINFFVYEVCSKHAQQFDINEKKKITNTESNIL